MAPLSIREIVDRANGPPKEPSAHLRSFQRMEEQAVK
jgi:hypothetical protein